MLLTYGFALADNPHALLLFGPPELLAGCAMARPELFSPDVVELLAAQLDQAAASYCARGLQPCVSCGSVVLCARFCDELNSVLSDSCWLQAAASGDLALFAFDAAAAAPRDSLVAALGMMAQAAIVSIATVSTTAIVSRGTIPIVSRAGA